MMGLSGRKKLSVIQPDLYLIDNEDRRLSQWGLGRGTHKSAFLSATKEAQ
jgi:hypothetical protein